MHLFSVLGSRPLGGIIFGRLGDEIGRKKILVITLMLIGVATFLIGLLPTYENIGIAAPAILFFLRFAQGVGVGGKWGGAVLLSSEFGDPHKRGFWASAAQIGPPAGNLMANGALAVLTLLLSEEAFLNYGWRIAFLISALLVAFGLWIRLKLEDSPISRPWKPGERSPRPYPGSPGYPAPPPDRGNAQPHRSRGIAAVAAAVWAYLFFIVLEGRSPVMLIVGTVLPLLYVRTAGSVRRRAVLPKAPLHRQLARLHLRRNRRGRNCTIYVHETPPQVRKMRHRHK